MKRKHLTLIAMAIISTILFVNCEQPVTKSESTPFDTSEPIEMEFVLVEGGTFTMGSVGEEYFVVLDPFYISKHEITQAQWEQKMGDKGTGLDSWNNAFGWGNNFPVYRVNFNDIQEFIKKLNASQNEYYYSLPTEAEWEIAARGGKSSQNYIYSGGNEIDNLAWYKDNSAILYREDDFPATCASHIVGQKTANELGLFDMSGNLSEMCSDIAGATYATGNTYDNPKGAESGTAYIVRGGNFMSDAKNCQVADRSGTVSQTERSVHVGFRLVRKPYIAVESLTLNEHKINLYAKEELQLSASILPVKASVQNVTWQSSKPAVATVDDNGLITAVSPNRMEFRPDTTMIYATTKYKDTEIKDSCMVIVGVIVVDNISLNETELELYVGQEFQLASTILPDIASFKDVTWKSSDATIATVDGNGKIKAIKEGIAVTITATTYNGLTATCDVTVVSYVAVTNVEISETDIEISAGATLQLLANVLPAGASNQKLTWSSDDKTIAAVSNSGLVMGLAAGTAKILVKTQDGGFEKICNVTVK